MILSAADGKFLDIGDVIKKPAVEFLHYCNYTQRKNEIDYNRIKRNS